MPARCDEAHIWRFHDCMPTALCEELPVESAQETKYRPGTPFADSVPMLLKAIARRLSPFIVGLFLAAQIFGVFPLVSEHTAHVAQTDFALAQDCTCQQDCVCKSDMPHGHYRGDADGFVQHHEMQDLSGVLSCAARECDIGSLRVAVALYVASALAEGNLVSLERPPKPILFA